MKITTLPPTLQPMNELAHNLWWSWNQHTWSAFERFCPETWKATRNPVKTMLAGEKNWSALAEDGEFLTTVAKLKGELDQYMEKKDTWYAQKHGVDSSIVYFCAEYGLHESLPIYSGGLGVLAGDHVKSASDLGIPMTFVGLFYANGYFTQQIDENGKQVDVYADFNPEELSLEPVLDANGAPLKVSVQLPERTCALQIWKAQVGRCPLYLLDSRLPENSESDRDLTARLYGGDRDMRMSQEIILGIGGIRALKAMGIEPSVYHMNEGHSGFFQLERIRQTMLERNLSFKEAKLVCASNCVFTTHTPVPAGNEAFSLPLMHQYFHPLIEELNLQWKDFVKLGLVEEKSDYKYFSLTVFALNVSRFANGVSELHGRIAKKMWKNLWVNVPEADNPIGHITNGVHVDTWMDQSYKTMLTEAVGPDWNQHLLQTDKNEAYWAKLRAIPHDSIKKTARSLKERLIAFTREQLKAQYQRQNKPQAMIDQVDQFLNPNALTIGFARRFATYKRATLVFKDLERLERLVNNPERPVQFVFAGKAHPADVPGQTFIREIYQISQREEFRGKIIILENYDMNISRHLISGVDIWLNNPRRPMEASGTSGQKVPLNFGQNFSVLDGWWREGFNGKNGWAIGKDKDYPSQEIQDLEDANDFYKTLEDTVLPLYYSPKDGGPSDEWVERCKEAFLSTIMHFSMDRVVGDYTEKLYLKAQAYGETFHAQDHAKARLYLSERKFLRSHWPSVTFSDVSFGEQAVETTSRFNEYRETPLFHVEFPYDDTLPGRVFEAVGTKVNATLYLGDITPSQVRIELVTTDCEKREHRGNVELTLKEHDQKRGLAHYETNFKSTNGEPVRLRLRAYPTMVGLSTPFEFGLCQWL
jgi:glycogen phosphorylase